MAIKVNNGFQPTQRMNSENFPGSQTTRQGNIMFGVYAAHVANLTPEEGVVVAGTALNATVRDPDQLATMTAEASKREETVYYVQVKDGRNRWKDLEFVNPDAQLLASFTNNPDYRLMGSYVRLVT